MMLRILLRVPGAKVRVCSHSPRPQCGLLQIHRSPFRNNVIRKIESVGLYGGIGFLLFCQLVVAVVGYEFSDGLRRRELN